MGVFLETISSFPTVPWTVLLGVVVLYWLLVILGALDLDVLDGLGGGGEALEGAGDGVAEGLAEGLGEGAAEGLGEGLGEGAAEGLADGAAEAGGGIADVVSALRLGSVPLTVVLSLTGVLAWILAYLGARGLSPLMQGPLGHWALGSGILVASGLCGLLLTSLILRPIVGRIPVAALWSRAGG